MIRLLAIVILSFGFAGLSLAAWDDTAEVELHWERLSNAARYQLEIAKDPAISVPIQKMELNSNRATLSLPKGKYYYRVRGIDEVQKPGNWAPIQAVDVQPPKDPPPVTEPEKPRIFPLRSKLANVSCAYETRGGQRIVTVVGKFDRPGWYLAIYPEEKMANAGSSVDWPAIQGPFELSIPSNGQHLRIILIASALGQPSEREILEIPIPPTGGK